MTDREALIEAYLLGKEIPDFDGKNQLEGELRRFGAKAYSYGDSITGILQVSDVVINADLIERYCFINSLSKNLFNKICKRLAIT